MRQVAGEPEELQLEREREWVERRPTGSASLNGIVEQVEKAHERVERLRTLVVLDEEPQDCLEPDVADRHAVADPPQARGGSGGGRGRDRAEIAAPPMDWMSTWLNGSSRAPKREVVLRAPFAIAPTRPRSFVNRWRIRSASPYRIERRTTASSFSVRPATTEVCHATRLALSRNDAGEASLSRDEEAAQPPVTRNERYGPGPVTTEPVDPRDETSDDFPEQLEPAPVEIEARPSSAARIARWTQRARLLRGQVEEARSRHSSVDFVFELVERDSAIGGRLVAGALAYRIFVFLLPFALLLASGLGLYSDLTEKSPSEISAEAGLTGLIAKQVTAVAASDAHVLIFVLTFFAAVYALVTLYRAIAIAHALAWHGSGRGVRISPKGIGVFAVALIAQLLAVAILGWIRRNDQAGAIAALLVYVSFVGSGWLVVSRFLPRRDVGWLALVPGALLVSVGMLFLNAFNVYVTTRLIESRADSYGVLGIAAALLFSLVLVGRLLVGSGELNATIDARRNRSPNGGDPGASPEAHDVDKAGASNND